MMVGFAAHAGWMIVCLLRCLSPLTRWMDYRFFMMCVTSALMSRIYYDDVTDTGTLGDRKRPAGV